MPFPTHPLRKFIDQSNKAVSDMVPKMIGFAPMAFCDFFENFNIIQTYSEKTQEYIHGVYSNNKLVGHIYLGTKYNNTEILQIIERIMPPEYDQMFDFVKNTEGIWYYKYDHSHYAFVYENVIKKVQD